MKTTVEISEPLLAEARQIAAHEGVTVRSLIEEGLRRVVEDRKTTPPFRLRNATFHGQGLNPELVGASWDTIRDMIYGEPEE